MLGKTSIKNVVKFPIGFYSKKNSICILNIFQKDIDFIYLYFRKLKNQPYVNNHIQKEELSVLIVNTVQLKLDLEEESP